MRGAWTYLSVGFGVVGLSLAGFAPPSNQDSDAHALFQSQCARCHSGSTPAGGIDLSSDLAAIAGIQQIVAGRPHSSVLLRVLRDGTMPKGGPKLGDDDINTLRDWIMSLRPDPRPLFSTRCVGCHSGTSPAGSMDLFGNLETLAKLPETKFGKEGPQSAVLFRRLADGSMPKGGVKLTDNELSIVRDWLNGLHPNPRSLFAARCVKCHGGATPAAGLDLSAGVNGLSRLKQVVKGNPGDSFLYKRIADGSMPRGGPPLSDSEAGLVWDWIASLAPGT